MAIGKWFSFANEQGNVPCLRVAYPWQLLVNFRAWAQNRDSALDQQFEKEAAPYLKQFLDENVLEWDGERCGQLSLQNFIAYYAHGGYLITPSACYKAIGREHEKITLPLAAIPLSS